MTIRQYDLSRPEEYRDLCNRIAAALKLSEVGTFVEYDSEIMDRYREAWQRRSKDRADYCEEQRLYFDFATGRAQNRLLE